MALNLDSASIGQVKQLRLKSRLLLNPSKTEAIVFGTSNGASSSSKMAARFSPMLRLPIVLNFWWMLNFAALPV